MVEIKPFRGTRYNVQLIEEPRLVMAPPYDVITPEQQESLYHCHPNNIVRLILGKEEDNDDEYNNKYTRAVSLLNSWKRDGILVDDMHPSLYFYEQEFQGSDGKIYKRHGFFALVKLQDYKRGKISAHEHTRSKPKADRLKLIRTTRANLSPVFVLYPDSKKETEKIFDNVIKGRLWQKFTDDDGITHKLWVVSNKSIVEQTIKMMRRKQLIIADGHHRYETALKYRDEMREVAGNQNENYPYDYVMMFLTSIDSEGLVILPTHRILERELGNEVNIGEMFEELQEYFEVKEEKVKLSEPQKAASEITSKLAAFGEKTVAFAMLMPGNKVYYLKLKQGTDLDELIEDEMSDDLKELDVVILHHYIISQVWIGNPEVDVEEDEIIYTHDIYKVFEQIRSRKAAAAFILNPPDMKKIKKIVLNGELMPPKTTYFHPKIISGLVIRDMNES